MALQKIIFSIVVVLFFLLNLNAKEKCKVFGNSEKSICFVGDSITHHGYYPKHIALYYITRFPEKKIDFINSGFEGGSTWTTLRSFDEQVFAHNADVYTIMLGMNDVRHHNYSEKALADNQTHLANKEKYFNIYKNGIAEIVKKLPKKSKVILLSSSIYDGTGDIADPFGVGRNGVIVHHKPYKGLRFVNDELNNYGQWCKSFANKNNLLFADQWLATNQANIAIQKENPRSSAIGRNRVHPFDLGGFFTATGFLKDMNEYPVVSDIEIDAKTLFSKEENATVSNIETSHWFFRLFDNIKSKYAVLEFSVQANSLPYPYSDAIFAATRYCDFNEKMNREILKVKNLKSGTYALKIDENIVGFYTSQELQNGINLGSNRQTPQAQQALEVERCVEVWRERTQRLRDLFGTEFILNIFKNPNSAQKIEFVKERLKQNKVHKQDIYGFTYYVENKAKEPAIKKQAKDALEKAYSLAIPKERKYTLTRLKESNSDNKYYHFKNVSINKNPTETNSAIICFGVNKNLRLFLQENNFYVLNADNTNAKTWIANNAKKYNSIGVIGVGLKASEALKFVSENTNTKAFVAINGQFDMAHPSRFNKMLALDILKAEAKSPFKNITKNNPPTLLINSIGDNSVDISEALQALQKFEKINIKTTTSFINTTKPIFKSDNQILQKALIDTLEFFKDNLQR